VYFDTAYIAKFYLNEPDSAAVRALVDTAGNLYSSLWAVAEFHGVLHRRIREGSLTAALASQLADRFAEHRTQGLWNLVAVSESLMQRTGSALLSLPPGVFIRTADAVHLSTAREIGERDVWTNDRHMLAAAPHFGLVGRSV
jgi:predicted nucleic acid-binding protein